MTLSSRWAILDFVKRRDGARRARPYILKKIDRKKESSISTCEILSSPLNYGGLTLKNRIIFAPTTLGLSQEEQLERLRQIAAGGCAMIILGDVPVLPHGFGPSLYTKKGRAWYRAVADAVHAEGCLLCAQLHQSDSNIKAMLKYLPGVLTKRISMEQLRPLLN